MKHDLDSDWMDLEPPYAHLKPLWETMCSWERAEKRRNFWRRMVVYGLWVLMMAAAAWWIPRINWGG